MSYDIKLAKSCDNKVVWDDHIVEDDFLTVILGVPTNSSNVVVRINDFKRSRDCPNEFLVREDISSQVTGTNRTFFVAQGPIYGGLKTGRLARAEEIVVRVKVTDEDVSTQFTGTEDYFYTQARPLLKSNNYDFNSLLEKNDIQITVNGVILTDDKIQDIEVKTGRIQLVEAPTIGDTVSITYYYQAKIKELDAQQSRFVLKEIPKIGQEVKVAYYSRQNDGWFIKYSDLPLIEKSQDIVFYKPKKTNRFFISKENVSNQFTGIENSFNVSHYPLLPLFQVFESKITDTLNNAVTVFINDEKVQVAGVNPETGKVTLFQYPKTTDIVEVSYYYQSELIPDRISVDYYVNSTYCDKCSKYSDLLDYSVDKLGNYEKVFDENKLVQDLKKIIRTVLESDPVAYWYGTSFDAIIGLKMFPDILKTKISNEIVTALSKLKSAQIQQEEYQTVTDAEFLDKILSITIEQSTSYPDLYTADIEVSTQSGRLVPVSDIAIQTQD
jgi:hypothetical protein